MKTLLMVLSLTYLATWLSGLYMHKQPNESRNRNLKIHLALSLVT